MSSIDERVVQMKFNNGQFLSGIKSTLDSLAGLKAKLNLDKEAAGLNNLQAAGSRFSLAGMATGIEAISSKFSALSIVGITALTNIANKAINAGTQLAQSLTIAPVKAGFDEYELKMGSIQTILANTARHGTSLETVNAEFEKLNEYADKTIYNFGDMTRNVGLFTASGMKVEDATTMIKGFSNAAATTGTSAEKASGAAYQLSQSLSSGKITLETWKSLSNAGMGNKNMQDGLIEIADAMGTFEGKGIDAIAATKDFNVSLEKGWLAPEVMSNYLKIMSGDMDDASIAALGLSDAQVKAFRAEADMGLEAAQKVRTYTQLIGTLQEAVGSGWSETFQLLLGDFTQATELFSGLYETFGPMIDSASDARNELIKAWADGGGRTAAIDAIKNAFTALMAIITPIKEAFREIFPPTSAATLIFLTEKIRDFMGGLKLTESASANLKSTFRGVFAVFDIAGTIIMTLWGILQRLWKGFDFGGGSILAFTGRIGEMVVKFADTLKNGEGFYNFIRSLDPILAAPGAAFKALVGFLGDLGDKLKTFFGGLKGADTSALTGGIENLTSRLQPMKTAADIAGAAWEWFLGVLSSGSNLIQPLIEDLKQIFENIKNVLTDSAGKLNFDAIFAGVNTGVLVTIGIAIAKFLGSIGGGDDDEGPGFFQGIKDAIGGLTDTLSAMQTTLKAGTLILIAGAIGILVASLVALSMIDSAALTKALAAMAVVFTQLMVAMAVFEGISVGASAIKMGILAGAMILLSTAVLILTAAVKNLSGLDWVELAKGLTGVAVLLVSLAGAAKIMSGSTGSLIQAGIGLMAVAVAIRILVGAVQAFSGMGWEELAKGLGSVAVLLVSLALFTKFAAAGKGAIAQGAGLILLAAALKIFASAVGDFAEMEWDALIRGMTGLVGVLAAVTLAMNLMPKNMLVTGAALVVVAGALKILAGVMATMAEMSWEEIGRGLTVLAASLVVIAGALALMSGALPGAAALIVAAGALAILAPVLATFGAMGWEAIGMGLTLLAASLVVIAGALYLMSAALPGAAALIVAAGALAILAPVLVTLGSMSWEQIGTGLVALAGALTVIGVAALVLTPVIPAIMGLGIAIGLIGIGAAAAGVGMLAFGLGLTAISAAGAGATAVLVGMVSALLGLLPYAIEQIGLGLLALIQVVADAAPAIIQAFIDIIVALVNAITQNAPTIIESFFQMIARLFQIILEYVPQFVAGTLQLMAAILNSIAGQMGNVITAGVNLIVAFLNGIAGQIGRVIEAGTNLIVSILNGFNANMPRITTAATNLIITFITEIGANAARIADAGMQMIVNFVTSLATSVRNNAAAMRSAGLDLATAIIDGMTGGIFSGASRVISAAAEMAGNALQAAKDLLDINSPSKKFIVVGKSVGEGFALGIDRSAQLSNTAAANMGRTAIAMTQETLSSLGDMSLSEMDITPTITPVIDLTAVRRGAEEMKDVLAPKPFNLDQSYAKAAALAVTARATAKGTPPPEPPNGPSNEPEFGVAGGNVTYVQNNYSPKALTRADIYRQTKNQLSTATKNGRVDARQS